MDKGQDVLGKGDQAVVLDGLLCAHTRHLRTPHPKKKEAGNAQALDCASSPNLFQGGRTGITLNSFCTRKTR